jgi:uncharacterized membrane protein/predicted DsbA family dithiol-disulfide isomerase
MTWRVTAFRVVSLIGLSFAALLAADDFGRVPAFCPFEGGCAAVTSSEIGRPLGVPLSALGVIAFGVFFGATLSPSPRVARALGPAAVVAGVVGLLLVAAQVFLIRRFCRLCLVVDGSAMLLAAIALGVPFRDEPMPEPSVGKSPRRLAWILSAAAFVAVGPIWSLVRTPPAAPDEVRRTWTADAINVVVITSFTCPYCRATDEAADELRRRLGDDVRLVRIVAPSPSDDAGLAKARTYQCAVRQGAGDRIVGPLFAAESYDEATLRAIALAAGLEPGRYDADLRDPTIDREPAEARRALDERPLQGLPQVWVQDILLFGEQSTFDLAAAVKRAAAARSSLR